MSDSGSGFVDPPPGDGPPSGQIPPMGGNPPPVDAAELLAAQRSAGGSPGGHPGTVDGAPPDGPVPAAAPPGSAAGPRRGDDKKGCTLRWLVLGFVAVVVAGAIGGWLWLGGQLNPDGPQEPVAFAIPEGTTTAGVADLLADAGVVGNTTVFRAYLRTRGNPSFEAGIYDGLVTNQPAGEVVDVLLAGPAPPEVVRITIPEGLWLSEIRQRVLDTFPDMDPADWDAAVTTVRSRYQPEGATLEGLLFPATYDVALDDQGDAAKLVATMVDTFDAVADELGLAEATERIQALTGLDLTPYEVLTLASLIESETRIEAERPQVARVMYNRLIDGMRLDIDASVIYALGRRTEVLTATDLDVVSPWNTRRVGGIPPSPIAATGRSAIAAALNPDEGPWLFYVLVDPAGDHFFTDDYDEFLRVAEDSRQRGVFQ